MEPATDASLTDSAADGGEKAAEAGAGADGECAVDSAELDAIISQMRSMSREEGRALWETLPPPTRSALSARIAQAKGARQRQREEAQPPAAEPGAPAPGRPGAEPRAPSADELRRDAAAGVEPGASAPRRPAAEQRAPSADELRRDEAAAGAEPGAGSPEELAAAAGECARRWPAALLGGAPEASEAPGAAPEPLSEADLRTIRADIVRTRAGDPVFQQARLRERLESLLVSFCEREGVGYTQGLHEVAAAFVFIEEAAPESHWTPATTLSCFVAFVRRFLPYYYDSEAFIYLHILLLFFRQLTFYHHPDLHLQLEESGVSPFIYATPWFLTLFASRTPMLVLLRFWDRYLHLGEAPFMLFMAVAMMLDQKPAILSAAREDTVRAVVRAGLVSYGGLDTVWDCAMELQKSTPKSFTVRLSRVLKAVESKRSTLDAAGEAPWAERVRGRVERDRHFVLLPAEVTANLARARAAGGTATAGAPAPGLPDLRLLLLDVRPTEEWRAEHMPDALHFRPACLKRLGRPRGARQPRLERLVAALSAAVPGSAHHGASAGAAGGEEGPPAEGGADAALCSELFMALQDAASARWGEGWLSNSEGAHLVLIGTSSDSGGGGAAASLGGEGGVSGVAGPLFEVLTEQLSLPRVSVVLGGASALHREAARRGFQLSGPRCPSPPAEVDGGPKAHLGGLMKGLAGGAAAARAAAGAAMSRRQSDGDGDGRPADAAMAGAAMSRQAPEPGASDARAAAAAARAAAGTAM